MKKILMIGAGIGQYFLSKKIKECGDYLVTVTLPGNYPVLEIADKVYFHDVFDKEGVLKIAQTESIDAVISDQNDMMMPTVAYVAESMNLPGLTTWQVTSYCNKNVFRGNCDKLNIPVPRHVAVSEEKVPEEFKKVPFPWIVKPADAQSSVGVEKVNNITEYLIAIRKAINFSKTQSAIVEEFFEGREIVAEGFIYNGKYFNLGFADRKYFDLENLFIPAQTIFPSTANKEILKSFVNCEERMAEYVKPAFAIVHSEYLYNETTNEFRVVESALRGGGVYISSHLIPYYTGIDVNDILIDCIHGKDIPIHSVVANRNNKAAGYVCFYLPEGVITRIDGFDKASRLQFVKMSCIDNIKVGDESPKLTHKGQRLGPFIVVGENRENLEMNINYLQQIIKVNVKGKDGKEYGIKWE